MDIDKRYIDFLANNLPYPTNKWSRRLGYVGLLLAVIGTFILMNALSTPIGNADVEAKKEAVTAMYTGIGISLTGIIGLGIAISMRNRERKKSRDGFLDYCEKNQSLPPYPAEEISKKKDPQKNILL